MLVQNRPVAIEGATVPENLGGVSPDRRMLLLPHCLRPSDGCPGRMTKQGLDCSACQRQDCTIWQIIQEAKALGYTNICVAPGGRLAARRVIETAPEAVIAVACNKELREGVEALEAADWPDQPPSVVQVPLLRDGCVDTAVDMDVVHSVLST
ncbi:MAG: DUF116 domain-containing protein [Anaerolineae bacterium]|nr:DUF116 domain-containing protein [Anaerolineae bacterium]